MLTLALTHNPVDSVDSLSLESLADTFLAKCKVDHNTNLRWAPGTHDYTEQYRERHIRIVMARSGTYTAIITWEQNRPIKLRHFQFAVDALSAARKYIDQ